MSSVSGTSRSRPAVEGTGSGGSGRGPRAATAAASVDLPAAAGPATRMVGRSGAVVMADGRRAAGVRARAARAAVGRGPLSRPRPLTTMSSAPPAKRGRWSHPSTPPPSRENEGGGGRQGARLDGLLMLLRAAASGAGKPASGASNDVTMRAGAKPGAPEASSGRGASARAARAASVSALIASNAPPRLVPLTESILTAVQAAGGAVTARALREAVGATGPDSGRALRALLAANLVTRDGAGGRGDPYTYAAVGAAAAGGGRVCGPVSRVGALLAALRAATAEE